MRNFMKEIYRMELENIVAPTMYPHYMYDGSNQPGENATCTAYNNGTGISTLWSTSNTLVLGIIYYISYGGAPLEVYNGIDLKHYFPNEDKLVTISSLGEVTLISDCGGTPGPDPADFTYYQAEYYDCVSGECSGAANPLWIYNLAPSLGINKYFYFGDNRSYKVLSAPYNYTQYLAAGSPLAIETNNSVEYATCTCLAAAPE